MYYKFIMDELSEDCARSVVNTLFKIQNWFLLNFYNVLTIQLLDNIPRYFFLTQPRIRKNVFVKFLSQLCFS